MDRLVSTSAALTTAPARGFVSRGGASAKLVTLALHASNLLTKVQLSNSILSRTVQRVHHRPSMSRQSSPRCGKSHQRLARRIAANVALVTSMVGVNASLATVDLHVSRFAPMSAPTRETASRVLAYALPASLELTARSRAAVMAMVRAITLENVSATQVGQVAIAPLC